MFHRTRTNTYKMYMKSQKTLNCQSNLEKKKNKAGLQTTLQSYSNQNSTVLTQKQTHRSMEKK